VMFAVIHFGNLCQEIKTNVCAVMSLNYQVIICFRLDCAVLPCLWICELLISADEKFWLLVSSLRHVSFCNCNKYQYLPSLYQYGICKINAFVTQQLWELTAQHSWEYRMKIAYVCMHFCDCCFSLCLCGITCVLSSKFCHVLLHL